MKAKKSLGQNFLKSELALKKIIEAGEIKRGDIILEIGPGKGALTSKLLEKLSEGSPCSDCSGKIIAVEKDRELFEFLKIKFSKEIAEKKLILLEDDILKFKTDEELSKFLSGPRFSGSLSQPDHAKNLKALRYKIIANIPYNITGAILKKFLTEKLQPERMILMVQHEVAKRIVASDKKESILSISVKAYGEPKMIMKVPARYFSPAPKVDSAIIAITNISRKNFFPPLLDKEGVGGGNSKNHHLVPTKIGALLLNKEENGIAEEKFWEIVKAGFAHKRKKLSSNLKNIILCQRPSLTALGNKRAEDLTLEDWILLAK
jgi:16S rRNA (adenine1518-N6/adenine1519-N6)-dimethyltransferase